MRSGKKMAILITATLLVSVFALETPASAQWPEPIELWSYDADVIDIAI